MLSQHAVEVLLFLMSPDGEYVKAICYSSRNILFGGISTYSVLMASPMGYKQISFELALNDLDTISDYCEYSSFVNKRRSFSFHINICIVGLALFHYNFNGHSITLSICCKTRCFEACHRRHSNILVRGQFPI